MNGIPTFVKWAGGKKQLIEQFKQFLPKRIERYFEPFVGGGAVAFYIIKHFKPKEVFLSDINPELINCLNVIKNNVDELIKILEYYKKKHSKETYYKVRDEDPELLSDVSRAARFIYLNKTCFNGLYRVNSKGQFNVPIGSYKNPSICSEYELREISELLRNASINQQQFYDAVKEAKKGDFIYFDPPYYPLNKGKSFTTYTKESFLEKEQEKLAEVFRGLNKKGCLVMISNSDTDYIKNLYKDFNIHTVKASRMINCIGTSRGKINEFVITNYLLKTLQKKLW
jgi:DNA adenine methylase